MALAFWEWMIRGDDIPPPNEKDPLEKFGLQVRDGKIKSVYGPFRARDLFKIPTIREEGPIWTFDRMGATRNKLPDGRVVCVGGEHEDYYDPDFSIYNDVVVFQPDGQIEIYGYPKGVFPPTDFHTATLDGNRLIIIGGLGYADDRRPGHTPVYSLDLLQYQMSEIATSGEMPGWLFKHEARYDPNGFIEIRGGEVVGGFDGEQRFRRNFEDYALDMRSWVWRRLTNRNCRQFSIRPDDIKSFVLERKYPDPEDLLPQNIEHAVSPCEGKEDARFIVAGVPVSLTNGASIIIGASFVEVVIEGNLPEALAARLVEEIRANTEAAIQQKCTVEEN
jgi:hypothetical protein